MQKTPYANRLRLAVGWVTLFTVGTDLFVVSPLLPTLAHRYAITPSTAGWMVTAFSLMYAAGAPWWGASADAKGKRPIIVLGLVGFSVGNALTGVAPTFSVLLAGRVLSGFSTAAVVPALYAITGDTAPPAKRGSSLAVVGSGLLMSLWAGAPLGTLVAQWAGWQSVFIGLSIASAGLAVGNWRVWPNGRLAPPVDQPAPSTRMRLVPLLADVLFTGVWGLAVYGFYTYLGTGLQRVDRASTLSVAAALAAYGVGATAGSLSGGRLADRFGARRLATAGLYGLGMAMLLTAAIFSAQALLYPSLMLLAFVAYAFFPAFQSYLAERYAARRAMAMAWNNASLYTGIALGAVLGGWVIHHWPFPVLPIICGCIALMGGVLNGRPRASQ